MRRFDGKVIVVTGSGRRGGLGEAILGRFAEEGANCIVSDLGTPDAHLDEDDIGTTDEMEAIASDLRERDIKAMAITCNVTCDTEVAGLIDATVAEFGRIDVLINNAGIGHFTQPILDCSLDDWQATLNTNLTGAFLATKHAARAMIASAAGGRIINIASLTGKVGMPYMAAYCSAKHGLLGLTRSTAVELAQHGITVNAVCPGLIENAFGGKQSDSFAQLTGHASSEAYLESLRAKNPLGRLGQPLDTAATCAWLASDDAAYITGEAINISGGEMLI